MWIIEEKKEEKKKMAVNTSLKDVHLKVTPDKYIEFPNVLYTNVQGTIKLENVYEKKDNVAFKIKTTAPKKYLVRPSAGIIKFGESNDVQIILQANDECNSTNKNISDRFLIQTCVVDSNINSLDKNFWVNVDKNKIQDKRLVVVFKNSNENNIKEENNCFNNLENNSSSYLNTTNSITSPTTNNNNYCFYNNTSASSTTGANNEQSTTQENNNLPNLNNSDNIFSTSAIHPNELKQKYELVQYCLTLEKQKNALQKENESLKQKFFAKNSAENDDKHAIVYSSSRSLVEVWHILPLLLGVFLIAKALGYL